MSEQVPTGRLARRTQAAEESRQALALIREQAAGNAAAIEQLDDPGTVVGSEVLDSAPALHVEHPGGDDAEQVPPETVNAGRSGLRVVPDDTEPTSVDAPSVREPVRRRRARRAFVEPVDLAPAELRTRVSVSLPNDLEVLMARHCIAWRAASGIPLTHSAVVDAALGSLPRDLPSLIELGKTHGVPYRRSPARRSQYAVREANYTPLAGLRDQLIVNGYSHREVLANDVYVAAVATWLDAMAQAIPDPDTAEPADGTSGESSADASSTPLS
jgi:hypothetical protein